MYQAAALKDLVRLAIGRSDSNVAEALAECKRQIDDENLVVDSVQILINGNKLYTLHPRMVVELEGEATISGGHHAIAHCAGHGVLAQGTSYQSAPQAISR